MINHPAAPQMDHRQSTSTMVAPAAASASRTPRRRSDSGCIISSRCLPDARRASCRRPRHRFPYAGDGARRGARIRGVVAGDDLESGAAGTDGYSDPRGPWSTTDHHAGARTRPWSSEPVMPQ